MQKSLLDEILEMRIEGFGDSVEGRPIIVVPQAEEDGNICLYNAVDFLANGKYVVPDAAKQQFLSEHGTDIINKVAVKRKMKGREITFEIRNRVERHHWRRVVGTFLLGPEWQFRDWPVKEEKPVTLFQKVRAFYLKYQSVQPHPNIGRWNVKVLQVNRERRYLDQGTQTEFWSELERFISAPRVKV